MNRIVITAGKFDEDQSLRLNKILSEMPDHTIVEFQKGCYFLKSALILEGKRDISFIGNASVLMPHYDREDYGDNCSDVFHVDRCEDLCFRDFSIETSAQPNVSGIVKFVNDEYADVELDPTIPFSGNEKYIQGITYNDFGTPTYKVWLNTPNDPNRRAMVGREIPCTAPMVLSTPHEKIGDHLVRCYSSEFDGLRAGEKVCIRHSYYGPVAFLMKNTSRVNFTDIRVHSFGGMLFCLLPRCADFTFERLIVEPKDDSHQYYSSNADGIHTTGLMGKLVMRDCVFRNLGDDIINIHTQAMNVCERDGNHIKIHYNKPLGKVAQTWAVPGDQLRVYDPTNFARKTEITVKDFHDGIVIFDGDTDVKVGDLVTNSAYFPEVNIENCVSYNMRDRSFVVQAASKLTVRGCKFYHATAAAIYLSVAFQRWLEAGPVENVEFTDNYIEGCGVWTTNPYAAVNVWARIEDHTGMPVGSSDGIPYLHRNINIRGNQFVNIPARCIHMSLVDGGSVEDNLFIDCAPDPIHIENCREIKERNNQSI